MNHFMMMDKVFIQYSSIVLLLATFWDKNIFGLNPWLPKGGRKLYPSVGNPLMKCHLNPLGGFFPWVFSLLLSNESLLFQFFSLRDYVLLLGLLLCGHSCVIFFARKNFSPLGTCRDFLRSPKIRFVV